MLGMFLVAPSPVSVVLEKKSLDEKVVEFEKSNRLDDDDDNGKVDVVIKSSLKKPVAGYGEKGAKKGRVKWMDFVGKELVEIREFESLESRESDEIFNSNPACMCVIQ